MGITPRLLKAYSLTITSKGSDGSYDDFGNWVASTTETTSIAKGSLQPFRLGSTRIELPEGVTFEDVRIFYTTSALKSSSEYTNEEADRTVINNIPYLCWNVEDWSTHPLNSAHYKVYWVKEDKMNG